MSGTDSIELIETWLAEGPDTAPERLMEQLPAGVARARQARTPGVLRISLLIAPIAAAAALLIGLVVSGVLRLPVGDELPVIPSPPAVFGEGARIDIALIIENRSDQPQGSWYWSGSSGSSATATPCFAAIRTHALRAPGVVRFGEVQPETEEALDRESLPVVLDTDSLPGSPVAFRDEVVPVWTYAYRISVSEGGLVSVEPLDAMPSVRDAGPICPVPDTSWPGGWPDVQAWLAERPVLPDCGFAELDVPPSLGENDVNTAARQCFYDAWRGGEDAQLETLTFSDTGPFIEVMRTSDGAVEYLTEDLRSPTPELHVRSCTGLGPPSDFEEFGYRPEDDGTLVFVIDPESCTEMSRN